MKRVISFVIVLLVSTMGISQRTLIYSGRLIDGVSNKVFSNKTIVVEKDRIVEIADGFLSPAEGDRVVDLRNATVMPGLMDMHTHLSMQFSERAYLERFYLNEADLAYRSTVFARRTLMAGFTTVREVGGQISTALRDAIARGWVVGPRIFSAGKSIATTGGHADPTTGLNQYFAGDPGPKEGVINGVAEARKAVRQRYKNRADLIKITATGGVLSTAKNGQNPQFTEDELRAIVETARDYGMHVAAHAHGAEGMKRAIRAGVRSIEHGTFMDDEVIALMKKHGTYYVPTISAGKWVAEKAKIDGFFPEIVRPKAARVGPQIEKTFARAYKAGVKIAFGTDSGVSPHGENAKEFIYMVEAGMKPMEAIQSATRVAAELLGISDRLGTLEAGKIADIIAVNGDPIADISAMLHVVFVMKEGTIYKQPNN